MKRPKPRQLAIEARPQLLVWNALPTEIRDEVLRLLVRMLKEHVGRGRADRLEVGDE